MWASLYIRLFPDAFRIRRAVQSLLVCASLEEYLTTARKARFTVEMIEDVSPRAVPFWTTTLAFMRAEARERSLSKSEVSKLEESLRINEMVRRALSEGGLRHLLLAFVRK
jgi:hypothetical protein